LAAAVTAGTAAGYALVTGPLLEGVMRGEPPRLPFGAWTQALPAGFGLAGVLVLLATVKALAQFLQGGLLGGLAQRVLTDLRAHFYARLLRTPPLALEARQSGELLNRFTADVGAVEHAVGAALGSYVRDTLQLVALLVVCATIDWRLFLLTFLVLPGAVLPVARFARSIKRAARRSQEGLGDLGALGGEALVALPVVQAYRLEPALRDRFEVAQAHYLQQMKRSLALRGGVSPTVELLGIAGTALLVSWGAGRVAAEPALAASLLSFLTAVLLLYAPLKSLSSTFGQMMAGLAAAERLFESLSDDEVDGAASAPARGTPPVDLPPLREGLRFEAVHARYPDGRVALDGLELTVEAGTTVALVGESGGGKSSLLSVVLGFLPLTSGGLHWDATLLTQDHVAALRGQLAWVPQDPVLFTGSVAENLRLAAPDASEADLWQALSDAGADTFVRALPGGLEAQVGERGARLSGGQRQRLCIARALLAQPAVLLLDEPTSALDADAEARVQAGLDRLRAGRTCLLVAHRLATAEKADRIAVISAGRVVESGSPAELRARGGAYARLWAAAMGADGRLATTPSPAGPPTPVRGTA